MKYLKLTGLLSYGSPTLTAGVVLRLNEILRVQDADAPALLAVMDSGAAVFTDFGGTAFTYDKDLEAAKVTKPTPGLWPSGPLLSYSVGQTASMVPRQYGGFVVRAVTGTVNVTVFDDSDGVSLPATPIHTQSAVAVGPYPWLGAGNESRRQCDSGLWFVMSGGGTVTIEPLMA